MVDYEKIGKRIAEERKYIRKVSQEKMAEDLYMYQADISNLEHARKGSGITDLDKLQLIAGYFDLPIENLLFGSSLEAHMVKYYGKKMEIAPAKGKKKTKNKNHEKILEKLIGHPLSEIDLSFYECGPYCVYVVIELQISYGGENEEGTSAINSIVKKPHLYGFYNDQVISNLVASNVSVFQVVNQQELNNLRAMIQPDILDVFDAARTINPYIPLAWFSEGEEKEQYKKKLYERMDDLRPVWKMPVVFIESVFVREDFRQYGQCRLLLDVLQKLTGEALIWLNMEPTAGEELEAEYDYIPAYTPADVGQLSLNAAIAERLGFIVDPSVWHRQAEVVDQNGNRHKEKIEIRKCAYYLPDIVKEIVKNDGNLVSLGRAKQQVIKERIDKDPEFAEKFVGKEIFRDEEATLDYYDGNDGDTIIHSIKVVGEDDTVYVFAAYESDGNLWCGVSHKNPARLGLSVSVDERYDYVEDLERSKYNDWLAFILQMAIGLNGLTTEYSDDYKDIDASDYDLDEDIEI